MIDWRRMGERWSDKIVDFFRRVKRDRRSLLFIILVAAFGLEWGVFSGEVFPEYIEARPLKWACMALLDASILFFPILALKSKHGWIGIVIIRIISIFLLANVLYLRFFGDIIPYFTYLLVKTVDPIVLNSSVGALEKVDLLYLVIPALTTVAYIVIWKKTSGLNTERRLIRYPVAIFIILVSLTILINLRSAYIYYQNLDKEQTTMGWVVKKSIVGDVPLHKAELKQKGISIFVPWLLFRIADNYHIPVSLDESRTREIDSFVRSRRKSFTPLPTEFIANRDKNLILVIVESLNDWMVEAKVGERYVMPFINKMSSVDGTIVARNIYSQITNGMSSDGHFIINTGILPLRNDIVAVSYMQSDYPALPRELKRAYSAEVILELPTLWNHGETSLRYGYDHLFSQRDVEARCGSLEINGDDSSLVDYTLGLVSGIPRPFFLQITTASTHFPFLLNGFDIPDDIRRLEMSETKKRSLAASSFCDSQIERLIEGLKAAGIYDDTIVVIVSDHDFQIDGERKLGSKGGRIFFMALNTGLTREIDKTVGLVDVYPTILQIMGRDNPAWPGVGISMLEDVGGVAQPDGKVLGNVDGERSSELIGEWDLSEWLIKSDYRKKFRYN